MTESALWIAGLSYVIGSLPVAWLVTYLVRGQDIRSLGSGNVGVMNVALRVARWAGLVVFIGEIGKGVAAVTLARTFVDGDLTIGVAVSAAVIGTRWSLWMGFKGGRGNTVGGAGMALISWQAIAAAAVLWVILRLLTRGSYLATRINLLLFPAVLGLFTRSWIFAATGVVLSALYLSTQNPETDDHLMIKQRWPNFWAFLVGPRRRAEAEGSAEELAG